MEIHKLDKKWVLWFHHVNDDNWSEESFSKLCEVLTIEDYWKMMNTITTFTAGVFFFMKEDISPRREDIENIDGGCWSFKISKMEIDNLWRIFTMKAIGNTLTKNIKDVDEINGITISPKINNCILKVWNKNSEKNNISIFNTELLDKISFRDAIYKKHNTF